MSVGVRKSVADIVRRKARSLLVLVAVALAVGGLVAINVADGLLSAAYAFTVAGQGPAPDVTVAVDKTDPALITDITRLSNVASVQQATTLGTQWHVAQAPGHVSFTITSYPDLRHVTLTPFELVRGRYPEAGEIVMEFGDSALDPFALGDLVTIDTAAGSTSLRVVGVARTSGLNPAVTGKAVGYMSPAGLRQLPANTYVAGQAPRPPLRVEEISIKLRSPADYQSTVDAIESLMRTHGATVLAVFPPERGVPLEQLRGIFSLVRILVGVALLLAAILLLNTIGSLVSEQTAVIGTMKALGATRARIARGYLTTVVLYSALATPVGIAAGVVAGRYLADRLAASIPLATGPFVLSPTVIGTGLAVGFGVPLVAALLPLWQGTRISVREALAAWGVTSVEAGRTGAVAALLAGRPGRIPQTVWLGLRGLLRRPSRAALSIATVATAAIAFLVVQSMAASVTGSIASVWGNLDADVEVYAGESNSYSQITSALTSVSNVDAVERVGWLGAQTAWGKVAVWGVEPDSGLYRRQLTSGRWFTSSDHDVVLVGDQLAARSGLRVGSTLPLTGPGGTERSGWTVIGTIRESVDDLSQVGAAVAPVNQVYELGGADPATIDGYTNRVLIRAVNRSPAAVDRLTRDVDAAGRTAADGRSGPIAEVFTFNDEVVRHQRNFTPLYVLLLAMAVVVAAVGVLGLADALGTSVAERRKDIGLMRTLGAGGRQIAMVFWIEGLALSTLAWLLAAAAGVPLAYLFVGLFQRRIMHIDFHLDPWAFAVMLAVTLAIATVASVAPALRAASLRAVDLLRYQ
jgi:putative ABC transport system permease protein